MARGKCQVYPGEWKEAMGFREERGFGNSQMGAWGLNPRQEEALVGLKNEQKRP